MKAVLLLVTLMGLSSCSLLMKKELEPVEAYIERLKRERDPGTTEGPRYIDIPVPNRSLDQSGNN